MNHGFGDVVSEQDDTIPFVLVFRPKRCVGHLRRIDPRDRVEDRCCSFTAHALALHRRIATHITQQFHQIGIVHHRTVEHQFLLSICQVLILAHAPCVRFEKGIINSIFGYKECFTTSLAEHFYLSQIVNEPQRVLVVAFLCQTVIDRIAKPSGLVHQFIFVARHKEASTTK